MLAQTMAMMLRAEDHNCLTSYIKARQQTVSGMMQTAAAGAGGAVPAAAQQERKVQECAPEMERSYRVNTSHAGPLWLLQLQDAASVSACTGFQLLMSMTICTRRHRPRLNASSRCRPESAAVQWAWP